ncbi:MAG: CHAT domain-containing protein [Leptolyngbya sp. SIO1E4]|nr:CHAT domain-containing protein [Leptolyngbya sp. SIO1E4]
MTQEFHLSITSLGSDRYLIRTEDTAMGVPIAEVQVEWPVETWLQLVQPAMDAPLMGVLKGQSDLGKGAAHLPQVGEQLYKALFEEEAIRESWLRAQGIAQNRHEMLRFRLGLKESRLQRLPWEVLHYDGRPLTNRSDLTFARYAANFMVGQTFKAENLPDADTPLKVLMVIASPQDQDHLQLLEEVEHIQKLLAAETEAILPIKLRVLKQPDRNELAQALEQGNYQVLHYAGHSDFGENGGDLSLVNRQTGLTEKLSGDDLAGLLVNNHVALTIFNSCRSGHTAGDDAEMDWRQQNLVQALVNQGMPSVIAMAERIPDEVAIAFTQLFYKNLRNGFPIDLSLSRTRQGLISAFSSDQHYWALPILYLQPDFNGYLTQGDRAADDPLIPDDLELAKAAAPLTTEPPPPDQTTTTFLTQLETPAPIESDQDEDVANFVKRLSEKSTVSEVPPLPAAQGEVLVDHDAEGSGMAIYDALPEAPLQETPPAPAPPSESHSPSSQNGAGVSTDSPQRLLSRTQPQKIRERSPLIWFALGLVGLVGVIGLAALALRWAGGLSEPPSLSENESSVPALAPSGSVDVETLIRQAEQDIERGLYGDAREGLELALTQELIGSTANHEVSDAIWPLVTDTQEPDLLYLQGRIIWQQIAQLGEDAISFDRDYQRRDLTRQARDTWEGTDNTFLPGRVARGFAAYAMGDIDGAITNLEAALALYDQERQQSPEPDASTPLDVTILHAYAGLVMARTKAADINPAGLEEDERLGDASGEEQAILNAEADNERAIAQELFLRLQELDSDGLMSPGQLQIVNTSPETWSNWLWTDPLLNEWRRIYREWGTQTSDLSE